MTRGRWLLALVVVLVIALAVVAVTLLRQRDDPPIGLLDTPRPGQAVAAFLSDGHPVWVIRHEDGSGSVLDAFSTHVPYGINKLTWWCPASRVIDDPFHGSRYDELGDYFAGPAPTGLREYPVRVEGNELQIHDAPVARPLRAGRPAPLEPPYYCTREEATVHDFGSLPEAESPAIAASADDGLWRRLHATLMPLPGLQSGLLCPDAVADDDCTEVEVPIEHLEPGGYDPFSVEDGYLTDVDWIVRADGGRIVEVAVIIPGG